MRSLVFAAVLSLCGGVAAAQEPASAKPSVVLCERDGMAERQLKREHGQVVWATASEVLAAAEAGEGWAAPRCMKKAEFRRMSNAVSRLALDRRARTEAQRVLARR